MRITTPTSSPAQAAADALVVAVPKPAEVGPGLRGAVLGGGEASTGGAALW